jgi:reactive chlorine resistance protein C
MTAVNAQLTADARAKDAALTRVGGALARYGLVVVIGWIGLLKFTSYEAQGIEPLVADSALLSWVYDVFSVTAFSTVLGVVEVGTAVLLAVKPWWPRISVVGSVMAVGLFLATTSFLVTTPGVCEDGAGGFPLLSMTGQFLVKDIALLGIAVWTLADALRAARVSNRD